MIQNIIDWLVNAISTIGYPGVFISVFLESFFAPIPSEIILPFSGFVASTGKMSLVIVIIIATVAAYLGSLPFYFIGRWGEKPVINFINKYGKYLFIQQKDIDKVFGAFDKYGKGVVFFGRLIPMIRALISFPAGVAKMQFARFSMYTLLGSLTWNILLTYAGYQLGDHWSVVSGWIEEYQNVILILIAIALVLYIIRGIKSRRSTGVKK